MISRNSAVRYAETDKNIQQIGDELGVDYVLEGTVRWANTEDGSRVRITPQLIQVADDTHLWADAYDRVIDDIFEVKSDIAGKVIRALDVTLQGDEQRELDERPTDSIEAYQAYLGGIDLYGKIQYEDSTRMFDKAVELDPSFAEAWAMLCRVHALLLFMGTASSETLGEAENALERAQALAPEDFEVRLARGFYSYHGLRDFNRALKEFEAITLDFPNAPEALEALAYILRRLGRWEDSVAALEDSLALDPQNAFVLGQMAWTLRSQREFEKAMLYLDRAITVAPDHAFLYAEKSELLLVQGSVDAARSVLASAPVTQRTHYAWLEVYYYDRQWKELLELTESYPRDEHLDRVFSDLVAGVALLQLERIQEATGLLEAAARGLEDPRESDVSVGQPFLSTVYAHLGRPEEAVIQVRRAIDSRAGDASYAAQGEEIIAYVYALSGDVEAAADIWDHLLATPYEGALTVNQLRLDPLLDPIRDHPRFKALLEKYGEEG